MDIVILTVWCALLRIIIIDVSECGSILSIPVYEKNERGMKMSDGREDIYPADDGYAMFLWVGSPVQILFLIIDIGSPITWFQCDTCTNCYPMQRPLFNTRASTSFKQLPCYSDTCLIPNMTPIFPNCTRSTCRYNMQYAYEYAKKSESRSFGMMVTETLNFEHSNVQIKDFIMGCGDSYEGPFRAQFSGVLGLGRGPLSLQSQLHAKAFSFCVVSLASEKPSSLEFYDTPPKRNKHNGSIMVPLSENSRYPYYYFLQFVGIAIDGFMLDIQSRVWGYGLNYDGGVVIDTGTVLTYLPRDAYSVFRSEILRIDLNLTKKPGFEELEFCYEEGPTNVFPTVEFYFQNGNIAGENFVSFKLDNKQLLFSIETGIVCLSFAETKNSALTVIGSNHLQGTLLMYDLVDEILVFTRGKC